MEIEYLQIKFVMVRSSWIRMTDVHIEGQLKTQRHTHREEIHVKMETEIRVIQLQAKDLQPPLEAGRGREGPALEPRRCLDSRLPARTIYFCCFEPPSV